MERIVNHPVLDQPEGREEVIFRFDGAEYKGFEGEMVSSALFANNIKQFSIHKKGDAPQGIFCANGQCSQCTVIIDGVPLKSCITPLKTGMDIRTLKHLPKLPADDRPVGNLEKKEIITEILIIGGGPSGLNAAIELAKLNFRVVLVDDKEKLGGKLLLQTHKFFGSEADCYAGTRGYSIGTILEEEVRKYSNVTILTNSSVVGVYKDQKAGVFVNNNQYTLIDFQALLITAGAREKSLVFPGNDLPGVYGAGAFQTLVNRDLVKSSKRILVIGSGNVGLIGAYHALQAGIIPVAIVEIAGKIGGYKVHADKITRMGVPVYLNTTVISVEGDGKVERVTIAEVDKNYQPLLETARTYEVDTVLIATGLSPVDEFYSMANKFGFKVLKAGDSDEIAEASSAMFGGKIAALKMARMMGRDIEIDNSYFAKAEVLKSHPGENKPREQVVLTESIRPIFHCTQEIPCNPCTTVCPQNSINLIEDKGTIMDLPDFEGKCIGCNLCVAACPGLAVVLGKKVSETEADITLPHEFNLTFEKGDKVKLTSMTGEYLEDGVVVKIISNKKYRTHLVTVRVSLKNAPLIAGIAILTDDDIKPLSEPNFTFLPDDGIVCRCERVSVGEIVQFIKDYRVRDVNQLKQIRVGMGACGSKTCSVLLPRVFAKAGVNWNEVKSGRLRPLAVEIPMFALVNEHNSEVK
ncbi:MAG: FAD-dependent oxidoreductase [Candidatus Delongbacteria bacterium]|nr:FAD-dependent oxidoreductase [Candidatus Delongbacteria bacterium]MBN2836653.1 FAD-dependent oxidoreductase [Candidatus Delongbacteria bacterium]